MKSRSKRNQEFEAIKKDLFEAGVSVINAAKSHEELFNTSIAALAEAVELSETHSDNDSEANPIYDRLLDIRNQAKNAGSFEDYVAAEEKLQLLEELEVKKIEREARKWEAQVRIVNAKQQLKPGSKDEVVPVSIIWTESKLKEKFKNLNEVRQSLGIEVRSWKEAVEKANQIK